MKISAISAILMLGIASLCAGNIPYPDPGHEGLNVKELGTVDDLVFGLWLQCRVLYNASNIPGPGTTTFADTTSYDFFRQRMRIGLDVHTLDKIGAYLQLEFRGGWGGSSPAASDPRSGIPVINPYNRLQARGVRYGFLYGSFEDISFMETMSVAAGIIPLTDRVGRTLFDADWDLNAGGILWGSTFQDFDLRIGLVRLIEGAGGLTSTEIKSDGDLFVFDLNKKFNDTFSGGLFFYGLNIPTDLGLTAPRWQGWNGISVDAALDAVDISGKIILNSGRDFAYADGNSGMALVVEAKAPAGKFNISALLVYSTGSEAGEVKDSFYTPHAVLGTEGYWGYTHIFNAAGPSDVNDLGLEIGNGGAGLTSFQVKVDVPINETFDAQLFAGTFQANEERNNTEKMAMEIGGMLTCRIKKGLNLEIGLAQATMDDFYMTDSEDIHEVFSRLQFTW